MKLKNSKQLQERASLELRKAQTVEQAFTLWRGAAADALDQHPELILVGDPEGTFRGILEAVGKAEPADSLEAEAVE